MSNSGARAFVRGLPRFWGLGFMQLAFFDEFGHCGPFITRSDKKHNTSPVFGLAGYIMPHKNVRNFATFFYKLKSSMLESEIKRENLHPATWEKKGNELINSKNIKKYRHIREGINRLINEIYKQDGRIIYYGREKYKTPQESNSTGLYTTVLTKTIMAADKYCSQKQDNFLMILDQHSSRIKLLESATKTMFGNNPARCLIEPPFEVESHLYQTVQVADWIAALIGRIEAYKARPAEYADWDWADRLFGSRLQGITTHSTMWRPR